MNTKPTYQELKTENNILRQKLKICKSNEKFNSYFINNKIAMLQIDTETKRIINANAAAVNFYGYSKEEVVQKTINDLNILSPDKISKLMKEAIRNKSNFFHYQHKLANGKIKDVEVYSSPMELDDKLSIIVTVYDITDRKKAEQALKESEEKYRLITENATDVIWVYNIIKTKFTYISPATYQLSGYTPEEKMQQSMDEVLSPESAKKAEELIKIDYQKFIKNPKVNTIQVNAFQEKRKNGSLVWIEISTILRFNADKEIEIVGVTRNIEDRKKAEQALKKSEAELKESNATKDKFFSIIAHDLKSPFNAILGFSDILLTNHEKYDNEKRGEIIEHVNNSANNAFKLLENLLTWSRSQSGSIHYSPEELNLKILLFETISTLQAQADKKEIHVLDEISKNDIIFADKNMIATVFRNLISNAIKFTRKNGTIVISSEKQQANNFIEISVSDTGVGIPKENIDDLFRIDKNTSTRGTENETGTGLGLILCKEFVGKFG